MSGDLLARMRAHSETLSAVAVPLPEWGLQAVHFRRASARQAEKFRVSAQTDAVRATVDLILVTACDPAGALLWKDDADTRAAFAGVEGALMLRLLHGATGQGGGPDAVEAEKKG